MFQIQIEKTKEKARKALDSLDDTSASKKLDEQSTCVIGFFNRHKICLTAFIGAYVVGKVIT